METIGFYFVCSLVPWLLYTIIKDLTNGSGVDKSVNFDNHNYDNLDL